MGQNKVCFFNINRETQFNRLQTTLNRFQDQKTSRKVHQKFLVYRAETNTH